MALAPRVRRTVRLLLGLLALTVGAYIGLLFAPGPLFRYAYAGTVVALHSDQPIPLDAGDVIARTEAKLRRSPLFQSSRKHDVYICNGNWRWLLLSSGNRRAAAIALLVSHGGKAIITRSADVASNRLMQASGQYAPNERTLDYYLAHEIAHEMTADFLGGRASRRLPVWVSEGYADYVGRGTQFDYADARAALLGDASGRRSPPQSGFYLRYVLLVAHLLDREAWSVEDLLRSPPDEAAVDARVRAGLVVPRK
jgi:hypothetical protein